MVISYLAPDFGRGFSPSHPIRVHLASLGGRSHFLGIHDIDIARWLLNVSSSSTAKQVNRVFASGQNIRHPELADRGDADNAIGTVEFMNGSMLTFHLSRTSRHGHDCFAEVFGEGGKVVVNG
jgi:myo-inositol 2-dehydrogenase/D-chiro-inositol 1-dehydrogenase